MRFHTKRAQFLFESATSHEEWPLQEIHSWQILCSIKDPVVLTERNYAMSSHHRRLIHGNPLPTSTCSAQWNNSSAASTITLPPKVTASAETAVDILVCLRLKWILVSVSSQPWLACTIQTTRRFPLGSLLNKSLRFRRPFMLGGRFHLASQTSVL